MKKKVMKKKLLTLILTPLTLTLILTALMLTFAALGFTSCGEYVENTPLPNGEISVGNKPLSYIDGMTIGFVEESRYVNGEVQGKFISQSDITQGKYYLFLEFDLVPTKDLKKDKVNVQLGFTEAMNPNVEEANTGDMQKVRQDGFIVTGSYAAPTKKEGTQHAKIVIHLDVEKNDPFYVAIDGKTCFFEDAVLAYVFNNNGFAVKKAKNGNLESATICPSVGEYSVTAIGSSAFYNCANLKTVEIPDTVMSINMLAFYGCTSLESINIPDSVIVIEMQAFYGCGKLTNVSIPDGIEKLENSAFDHCGRLTLAQYENAYYLGNQEHPYLVAVKAVGTDIKSCKLSETTRVIYSGAFSGCKEMESIEIPETVRVMGAKSFKDCKRLDYIYYHGASNLEWNKILGCAELSFSGLRAYYYAETSPLGSGKYWHYVEGIPTPW